MLKGYITLDNVYYESLARLNPSDTEVPLRRQQSTAPPVITATQPPPSQLPNPQLNYGSPSQATTSNASKDQAGMFGNVGWKDVITFIYFLSGVAALWINMSERTLIMEQRANAMEKEIGALRVSVKENESDSDAQIRLMERTISELRIDILKNSK